MQTTKDYSVMITNPPSNVKNPDEYYNFFKRFGDVVSVTVAKRNGKLLKAIADKEVALERIDMIEHDEAYSKTNSVKTVLEQVRVYVHVHWLTDQQSDSDSLPRSNAALMCYSITRSPSYNNRTNTNFNILIF